MESGAIDEDDRGGVFAGLLEDLAEASPSLTAIFRDDLRVTIEMKCAPLSRLAFAIRIRRGRAVEQHTLWRLDLRSSWKSSRCPERRSIVAEPLGSSLGQAIVARQRAPRATAGLSENSTDVFLVMMGYFLGLDLDDLEANDLRLDERRAEHQDGVVLPAGNRSDVDDMRVVGDGIIASGDLGRCEHGPVLLDRPAIFVIFDRVADADTGIDAGEVIDLDLALVPVPPTSDQRTFRSRCGARRSRPDRRARS